MSDIYLKSGKIHSEEIAALHVEKFHFPIVQRLKELNQKRICQSGNRQGKSWPIKNIFWAPNQKRAFPLKVVFHRSGRQSSYCLNGVCPNGLFFLSSLSIHCVRGDCGGDAMKLYHETNMSPYITICVIAAEIWEERVLQCTVYCVGLMVIRKL